MGDVALGIPFCGPRGPRRQPSRKNGEPIGPDNWANRFLRNMVPLVAWKAAGHPECTRLELTYELESGRVAIASVPLAEESGGPQWWSGATLKPWVERR